MRSRSVFLRNCIVFFGLTLASLAVAAAPIVVEKDSPLYEAPQTSAKVVGQVKQGMTGESITQKGQWVNVKTAAGTGWMYAFNVKFGAPGSKPAASVATPVPRRVTTATIGIRGLEADDRRQASYDAQQLGLLDKYAASKQEAERAARDTGLSACGSSTWPNNSVKFVILLDPRAGI